MPDKKNADDDNREKPQGEKAKSPQRLREVIVRHLDEPPPSGKRSIHPRRPAPIVPTRKPGTGDASDDSDRDKSSQK
jgi:hypothetical protein